MTSVMMCMYRYTLIIKLILYIQVVFYRVFAFELRLGDLRLEGLEESGDFSKYFTATFPSLKVVVPCVVLTGLRGDMSKSFFLISTTSFPSLIVVITISLG